MYLSKVEIDINNRTKTRDLSHLGAYHNWVEKSFPNEIAQKTRSRKLWRIDKVRDKYYLLVVSPKKPDLNKLEKYGKPKSAKTIDYDNLLNNIKNGMKVRFKIVVNPTFSKSSGKKSGKRGKIMQCLSYDDQLKYLKSRDHKNGFKLVNSQYTITNKSLDVLMKNKKHGYIRKVCYEGYLIVEDKNIFIDMLCHGLGHKKAYGCGLMTIIP